MKYEIMELHNMLSVEALNTLYEESGWKLITIVVEYGKFWYHFSRDKDWFKQV